MNPDLQKQIDELKKELGMLKSSDLIPLDFDQAFRDRFKLDAKLTSQGTGSAATQSVSVPSTPTSITVPAQPSGTLQVLVNGTVYNLLYA